MFSNKKRILAAILIVSNIVVNSGFEALAYTSAKAIEDEISKRDEKNYYEEYVEEYTSLLSANTSGSNNENIADEDEDITMDEENVINPTENEIDNEEYAEEKEEDIKKDVEKDIEKETSVEEEGIAEKEVDEITEKNEQVTIDEEKKESEDNNEKLDEIEIIDETEELEEKIATVSTTSNATEIAEEKIEDNLATESEIFDESEDVATDSEVVEKIDDEISTDSEVSESEIKKIATNSSIAVIATFATVNWKLKKVLVPDVNELKAYSSETNEEIKENRLAKTVRVLLVNENKETKIIRVRANWKAVNNITINAKNRMDQKTDESYLIEEVNKREKIKDDVKKVAVKATDNQLYIRDRIYEELSQVVNEGEELFVVSDNDFDKFYEQLDDSGYVEIKNVKEYIEVDEIEENEEIELIDRESNDLVEEKDDLTENEYKNNDEEEINIFDEDGNLIGVEKNKYGNESETKDVEEDEKEIDYSNYAVDNPAPGSLELTEHQQLSNYYINKIIEYELDMDKLMESIMDIINTNQEIDENGEVIVVGNEEVESETEEIEEKEENFGFLKKLFGLAEKKEIDDIEENLENEDSGYQDLIEEEQKQEIMASAIDSSEEIVVPKQRLYGYTPANISNHEWEGHKSCGERKGNKCTHQGMYVHQALTYERYTPNDPIFSRNTIFVNATNGRDTGTLQRATHNNIYLSGDTTLNAIWALSYVLPKSEIAPNVNLEVGYYNENDTNKTGDSLNICLNGFNLTFGFDGVIQGIGRVNICNCSSSKQSRITGVNVGTITIRDDGKIVEKVVSGRQGPCIRTTSMGIFGDILVTGIINETLLGTGNSAPDISDGAGFYGFFKPTENEKGTANLSISNLGYYIYDDDKKDIPLYYRVEVDGVKFSEIYSNRGSGAAINAGVESSVDIRNAEFSKCTASNAGGAVCANAQNINFKSVVFNDCKAGVDGGAIYLEKYGTYGEKYSYTYVVSKDNIKTIEINPSFNSTGKDVNSFEDMSFERNQVLGKEGEAGEEKVGGRGGAIAILYVNSLTKFENIVAKNNYANLSGGFLLWQDSSSSTDTKVTTMSYINCESNHSGYSGGTMAIVSNGEGDGYINVAITGMVKDGQVLSSKIKNTSARGNIPALIVEKKENGKTVMRDKGNGVSVPVYEKIYYDVLGTNYYLGSMGGAFYIEGCNMQIGEAGKNYGHVEFTNCFANDGGALYVQQPRSAYFYQLYKSGNTTKVYKQYEYNWDLISKNRYYSATSSTGWLDIPKIDATGKKIDNPKYYYDEKKAVVTASNATFVNCKTEDGEVVDGETINTRVPISEDAPEVMGNYDELDPNGENGEIKYFNNREYITSSGGGCIYVGNNSDIYIVDDVKITECTDSIYLCNGNITFQNIKEGNFSNNKGSYIFGYPSIPDIGNNIIIDNTAITNNYLTENSFSLTNVSKDGKDHIYTTLTLKNKCVVKDNYKNIKTADNQTKKVDMDVFLNLRTLKCNLDYNLDYDTSVGIYPDFKSDQLLFSTWDKEHLKWYEGLVVSENFYLNNSSDKESDFYDFRFYRDNEKIYIGKEWDTVNFTMEHPDPAKGGEEILYIEPHYIYNKTTGSIVSKPRKVFEKNVIDGTVVVRELNNEGDFIEGYSYVGFLGKDEQEKYKNEPFLGWEFEENQFRGSKYDGPLGTANDNFSRRLFAVFTDDVFKMKSCGTPFGEECRHANSNLKHYTERGGATDSESKVKNFVVVTTFSQLYFTNKGRNTQYMLVKDVAMTEGCVPLKGNMMLYMNGFNIDVEVDMPLFDFGVERDFATKEKMNQEGTVYDESVGGFIIGSMEPNKKSKINYKNGLNQPFVDTVGKKIYMRNIDFSGYNITKAGTSFFADSKQTVAEDTGVYVENSKFENISIADGNLINTYNVFLKDVEITNCSLYGNNTYNDLISLKQWAGDIKKYNTHILNTKITNITNVKNLFSATLYGDSDKSGDILFENVEIRNNQPKETLIKILNGNDKSTPTFRGNNYIENNTVDRNGELIVLSNQSDEETRTYLKIDEGNTYIRYNNIEDDPSQQAIARAALYINSGNIEVNGHFEVVDNYFTNYKTNTTPDDGHVNAGIYMNRSNTQIVLASGSLVVKNNRGKSGTTPVSSPQTSNTYQIYVANSTDARKNNFLFRQKENTKLDAINSEIIVHTLYSPGSEYKLYRGWYSNNVQEYNTIDASLSYNTFFLDDVKTTNDNRELTKMYTGEDATLIISSDFIDVEYMLYNVQRTDYEWIVTQRVSRGKDGEAMKTQLECPTYGQRIFWTGPTYDYMTSNRYEVYHRNMFDATITIQSNLQSQVSKLSVYGYHSEAHTHEIAEGINNEECDFWIEASEQNHLSIDTGAIFLRRDVTITDTLFFPVDRDYSLCLNGYNLYINNTKFFETIKETGINIYITDCKKTGRIHPRPQNNTTNATITPIEVKSNTLNISNVKFADFTTEVPIIKMTETGNLRTSNLTFSNVRMIANNSNQNDRMGIIDVRSTNIDYCAVNKTLLSGEDSLGSTMTITGSNFAANKSFIYIDNLNVATLNNINASNNTLANSLLDINKADYSYISGGVYNRNTIGFAEGITGLINIANSNKAIIQDGAQFTNNESGGNGAVLKTTSKLVQIGRVDAKDTLYDVQFIENKVQPSKHGSVIYAGENSTVEINNALIRNNFNALYVDRNAILTLNNAVITENTGAYVLEYKRGQGNVINLKNTQIMSNLYTEDLNIELPSSNINKTIINLSGSTRIVNNKRVVAGMQVDYNLYLPTDETIAIRVADGEKLNPNAEIGLLPMTEDMNVFESWDREHIASFSEGAVFENMFKYDNAPIIFDFESRGYKMYRSGKTWKSGANYDVVTVYVDKNILDSNLIQDTYVDKLSKGTLIDMPALDESQLVNHTFVGFIGRSSVKDNKFVNWNFAEDMMKGSAISNDVPFERALYAIFTDDRVKLKACGHLENEQCEHEDNVSHVVRGGVESGTEEAKYMNYISVSTTAQLYFKYSDERTNTEFSTQYILTNDIYIYDKADSIQAQVINLAGHNIYVSNNENTVFVGNSVSGTNNPYIANGSENATFIADYYKNSADRGKIIGINGNSFKNGLIRDEKVSSPNRNKLFMSNVVIDNFVSTGEQTAQAFLQLENETLFENVDITNNTLNTNLLLTNSAVNIKNLNISGNTINEKMLMDIENSFVSNAIRLNIKENFKVQNNTLKRNSSNKISFIKKGSKVNLNINSGAYFEISGTEIYSKEQMTSSDVTVDVTLFEFVQDTMSNDMLLGDLIIENTKMLNFSSYTSATFTAMSVNTNARFNIGGIAIKIEKPDSQNVGTTVGLSMDAYNQNVALLNKINTEPFKASRSNINLLYKNLPTNQNQLLISNWYYGNIADYNSGLFTANTVFESGSSDYAVHKYSVGNFCNVYIGAVSNVGTVEFYERVDGDDRLVDVQYLRSNVETTLERIKSFDTNRFKWIGPNQTGEIISYTAEIISKTTSIFSTTARNGTVLQIIGESSGNHFHSKMVNYGEDDTYFDALKLVTDFQKKSENYYLVSDFVLTQEAVGNWLIQGAEQVICLNGHKLTFTEGITYQNLNGKSLYITDCKGNGSIQTVVGTSNQDIPAISMQNFGTFAITNVLIDKSSSRLFDLSGNGTVLIRNVRITGSGNSKSENGVININNVNNPVVLSDLYFATNSETVLSMKSANGVGERLTIIENTNSQKPIISFDNSKINLHTITITNNEGQVFRVLNNSILDIENAEINKNSISDSYDGSVFYSVGGGGIKVLDSRISENKDPIFVSENGVFIASNSNISSNTGSYAIGYQIGQNSKIYLYNSQIVNNNFTGNKYLQAVNTAKTEIYIAGNVQFKNNKRVISGNEVDCDIYIPAKNVISIKTPDGYKLSNNSRIGVLPIGEDVLVYESWDTEHTEEDADFYTMFYYNNAKSVIDYDNLKYKMIRDNNNFISGPNFDEIYFYTRNAITEINIPSIYIHKNSTGTYIDEPYFGTQRLSNEGYTFAGFIGRSAETGKFVLWDFARDKFVGSGVRNNLPYDRILYAIFTDSNQVYKTCGNLSNEACNHTRVMNHQLRGGAAAGTEQAKYQNYVVVTTTSQLFYKYKLNNDEFSTQYILYNDITIPNGLETIDAQVINTNGKNIYVNNQTNSAFSLSSGTTNIVYNSDFETLGYLVSREKSQIIGNNITITNALIDDLNTGNRNGLFISNVDFDGFNTSQNQNKSAMIYSTEAMYINNSNLTNINSKASIIKADSLFIKDSLISNCSSTHNNLIEIGGITNNTNTFVVDGSIDIKESEVNSKENQNTILYISSEVNFEVRNAAVLNVSQNKIYAKTKVNSMDDTRFAHFIGINQTANSTDQILGSIYMHNNTFYGFGVFDGVYLRNIYTANKASIVLGNTVLDIDNPVVDGSSIVAGGIGLGEFNVNRALFTQLSGTKFNNEESQMTIDAVGLNNATQKVYEGWFYENVARYNDGTNLADAVFGIVNNQNATIYKSGEGNDATIYIGNKNRLSQIQFYLYDNELDTNVLYSTQYIAPNVMTSFERIELFINAGEYTWTGPDENGIGEYSYSEDKIAANTVQLKMKLAENEIGKIYGSSLAKHVHGLLVGTNLYKEDITFRNITTEQDFTKGYSYVYLQKDLELKSAYMFSNINSAKIGICLNGNKLTIQAGNNYMSLMNKTFTITDCKETGIIESKNTNSADNKYIFTMSGGSFHLSNVELRNIEYNFVNATNLASSSITNVTIGTSGNKLTDNPIITYDIVDSVNIDNVRLSTNSNAIFRISYSQNVTINNLYCGYNYLSRNNTLISLFDSNSVMRNTRIVNNTYTNNTYTNPIILTISGNSKTEILDNLTISGNTMVGASSLIQFDSTNYSKISYATITNNSGSGYVIKNNNFNAYIDFRDFVFDGNIGGQLKGIYSVYAENDVVSRISNIEFKNNNMSTLLEVSGSGTNNMNIEDITIKGNTINSEAALIRMMQIGSSGAKKTSINNLTIQNNNIITNSQSVIFMSNVSGVDIGVLTITDNSLQNTVMFNAAYSNNINVNNIDLSNNTANNTLGLPIIMQMTNSTLNFSYLTVMQNKSVGSTDGGGIYLTGSSINVNSDVAISGNKFKRFAAIYAVLNSTFNAISETANFTMESNEVGGEYSSAIYALSSTINISRPQFVITNNIGGTKGSVYLNNSFFNVAGHVYITGNKTDNNNAVRNLYLDGTGNSSIGVYNNGKINEDSYIRVYKPSNLANTLVFTNWNEANVESFNTGEFFFPENLIGVDEELVNANWHIYRYGTGSLLYIGVNYVNLKFVNRDMTEIAVEYVARNVLTTVDKVVLKDLSLDMQSWEGPSATNENEKVDWDMSRTSDTINNVNLSKDGYVMLMLHVHKDCGLYNTSECNHYDGTVHTETYMYKKVNTQDDLVVTNTDKHFALYNDLIIKESPLRNNNNLNGFTLCLNGHTLTVLQQMLFLEITQNETINICDCVGTGKITSDTTQIGLDNDSFMFIYRGKLNVYGINIYEYNTETSINTEFVRTGGIESSVLIEDCVVDSLILNEGVFINNEGLGNVVVNRSTFSNAFAYQNMIYGRVNINASSFVHNSCYSPMIRGSGTIKDSRFEDNNINVSGIAAVIYNEGFVFDGFNEFTRNISLNPNGRGAAIYFSSQVSNVSISNIRFIENESPSGSAIYVDENASITLYSNIYMQRNLNTIYNNGGTITFAHKVGEYSSETSAVQIVEAKGNYVISANMNLANNFNLLSGGIVGSTATYAYKGDDTRGKNGYIQFKFGDNFYMDPNATGFGIYITDDSMEVFNTDTTHVISQNTKLRYYATDRDIKILDNISAILGISDGSFKLSDIITIDNKNREGEDVPYGAYHSHNCGYIGYATKMLYVVTSIDRGYYYDSDNRRTNTISIPVTKYKPISNLYEPYPNTEADAFLEFNKKQGKNVEGAMTVTNDTLFWSDEDETIYCLWKAQEYTIMFDKNSDLATGNMQSMTLSLSERFDMPALGFSIPNVKLKYWQDDYGIGENGERVVKTYGENEKNINPLRATPSAVVVLKAIWDIEELEIIYNPSVPESPLGEGYNEVIGTMAPQTILPYNNNNFVFNDYVIDGYKFEGWSERVVVPEEAESANYKVPYENGKEIPFDKLKEVAVDGKVMLYAVWTRREYDLHIHINDVSESRGSTKANLTGFANGQTVMTKTVRYDSVLDNLPTGDRKGYNFGYYTLTPDIEVKDRATYEDIINDNSVMRFTTNKNIYALWVNKEYSVELNIGTGAYWSDGSARKTLTMYFDEMPTAYSDIPVPSRNDNYKFDYWSVQNNGEVDFRTLLESQTTYDNAKAQYKLDTTNAWTNEELTKIAAIYLPTQGKIIFEANASDAKFVEGNIESYRVEYLVDINEPINKTFVNGFPTPIRPGYTVVAWTKSPTDPTAESLDLNMVWTSIAYETIYYAHYTSLTYNVSYSTGAAGNEASQVIPNTNNVSYGNPFTLPGEVYSWAGHKQVGWYIKDADTDSEGTVYAREIVNGEEIPNTKFQLGATVKNLTNQQGKTVELIAMWDEFDNFYYIRFNKSTPATPKVGDTNIVEGNMPNQLMPLNTATKINENQYTLKGYEFSHWVTSTGVIIGKDDTVTPLTNQEEAIIDVYAVWTNLTYYWEYKFPANTTNVGTTSLAVVYDRSIPVPNVTYSNEVYQIWGWSLTEDNTNYNTYAEAQSHIITSANVSSIICRGDAVLYPICKKLLAEIKYVTEDGVELQLENMPTFIRVGQEVRIPIPTRDKYEFDGWGQGQYVPEKSADSTSKGYIGELIIPARTVNDEMVDVTFITYWLGDKYTIILNANGRGTTADNKNTYEITLRVGEVVKFTAVFDAGSSYSLNSFNSASSGNGTRYGLDVEYKDLAKEGETINLYAIWVKVSSSSGNRGGSGGSNRLPSNYFTNTNTNTNTNTQNSSVPLPQNITIVGTLNNNGMFNNNSGFGANGSYPVVVSIGDQVIPDLSNNMNNQINSSVGVRQNEPSGNSIYTQPVSDVLWNINPVTNKWQANSNTYGKLTGWNYIRYNGGDRWYYFDTQTGDMATGWITLNNKNYYLETNNNAGYMVTGNQYINGNSYLFNTDGNLMQVNGQIIGGYQNNNVLAMLQTYNNNNSNLSGGNWEYDPTTNNWKHFDVSATGAKEYYVSGWFKLDSNNQNNWYLFDAAGNMVTGWVVNNGKYYYLSNANDQTKGAMVKGWQYIDGKSLYFGEDGTLLQGSPTTEPKVQSVLISRDLTEQLGSNVLHFAKESVWNNDSAIISQLSAMTYNNQVMGASYSFGMQNNYLTNVLNIVKQIKNGG